MSKVIKKNLKPASTNKVKLTSQKISELQNVRIMQKNLVYVIGLSAKIASSDVTTSLTNRSFFRRNTSASMAKLSGSLSTTPKPTQEPMFPLTRHISHSPPFRKRQWQFLL